MRFLMLNWRDPENPKSGGAERVSQAYLLGLKRRGHEVCWFANDFPGAQPEQQIDGIQVLRGGGQGTSILKAREWFRRQKRFDLVIDQHHGIPWFAPWWSGTRSVAYIHEVLGPIWSAFYPWPISWIGRCQERWTHWLYRRVPFWTPSESTRRALQRNGVRQVCVFPNGTDTTPLPGLEDKPLTKPIELIAVSRLAPNKRVDHAIETVRLLLQLGVDTRLTVMGNGEAESALRQQAAAPDLKDRIVFSGRVTEEQKNLRLRQAHLLVHTSIREGWGLNVIEANAMGTPAVVYPVGGLVDSTVHGQTGIVCAKETPASLADAIQGLVRAPEEYARLRLAAWNRSKTFQWDRVIPPVCDWLESLARGESGADLRSAS